MILLRWVARIHPAPISLSSPVWLSGYWFKCCFRGRVSGRFLTLSASVRASFACNIRLWKRLSHVEPMQARGPQPRSAPPPPSPLLLRYVSPLLLENSLHIHVRRSPRLRSCLVWTQAAAGPPPGALIYGLTSGSCPNIASLLTRAETRCCVDLILPWTPVALPSEA